MRAKQRFYVAFFTFFGLACMTLAAQTLQACPPTSCSVVPEADAGISKILKERVLLLPPEGSLSIGPFIPSSFAGLQQATITLNVRGNSKAMPLFESSSGAYILFGQPFDVSSETAAGMAADVRSFFTASNPAVAETDKISASPLPGLDVLRVNAVAPDVGRNFLVIHDKHTLLVGPVMVTDGRYNSLINRKITSRSGFAEGPVNAPVTIVEYSDLACPACGDVHAFLANDLLAKYPGRVRVIHRNFPMTRLHPSALSAARAATCVELLKPTASSSFTKFLFAHQAELKSDAQTTILQAGDAQQMGPDFQVCVTTKESFDSVQADVLEGSSVGVATTPTMFLNGEAFIGMPPKDVFAARIAEVLGTNVDPGSPRRDLK